MTEPDIIELVIPVAEPLEAPRDVDQLVQCIPGASVTGSAGTGAVTFRLRLVTDGHPLDLFGTATLQRCEGAAWTLHLLPLPTAAEWPAATLTVKPAAQAWRAALRAEFGAELRLDGGRRRQLEQVAGHVVEQFMRNLDASAVDNRAARAESARATTAEDRAVTVTGGGLLPVPCSARQVAGAVAVIGLALGIKAYRRANRRD
jgi:hypothetical protein